MQYKRREKRLHANMVKKFSISSIRRSRNNNHCKKVKIRYDFLCNSRGHRVGEEIQGSTKLLVSKHKEQILLVMCLTLTDKEIETLYSINKNMDWEKML